MSIPIIQGGMGIGVSLGRLAGSVMKEGGMGVISAAQPGYNEPDFYKDPVSANLRALKKEIAKARLISEGHGLLGINLMVAGEKYDIYATEIAKMDIDAIISGAGLPLSLPQYTEGFDGAIIPIVSSGKAAKLLCKRYLSSYQRLPDALVIEGPMAGGHLGFTWDQVNRREFPSLESIFEDVKRELNTLGVDIPVFVAGGIYTSSDIATFMRLGASGVQMGTRFIATEECDASDAFKQTLIDAKEEDIDFVLSPSGYPGRAVKTQFTKTLKELGKIKVKRCVNCLKPCNPADTVYCITEALIEAVKGNISDGLVFSGANGYRVHSIVKVKELIKELLSEMEGFR